MLLKSLKYFLYFFVLLLLIIAAWFAWEHSRDPVKAIDKDVSDVYIASRAESDAAIISQKRRYIEYRLKSAGGDSFTVYCSFPENSSESRLPVMIILGGLHIGRQNFEFIPSPGNNILIIYSYPYSPQYWYEGAVLKEIPKIRNAVISVPAQVVQLLHWIKNQSWADRSKISVLGYSFGALFVPAVYRLADKHKLDLNAGIMCYGGADIRKMLYANLKKMSEPSRTIVSYLASAAISVMEPELHLPHLKNEFLLINGTKDNQIPKKSWQLLHHLTPDPKTIKILDEGHMHPDKPELTQKLVRMSQEWLIEKGVSNP